MTIQEPPYEDAINWLQFAYTGDSKGCYVAPENTDFTFALPVEGEVLLLPALEHPQTLYPGAYTQGANSKTPPGTEARKGTHEGKELELGKHTHTGAAGFDLFPGGSEPSSIRASGSGGAHYDLLPVTRGFIDGAGSEDHGGVITYG